MKKWQVCLFAPLLLGVSCSSTRPTADAPEPSIVSTVQAASATSYEFVLGYGDEISVNVWRNEDLSRSAAVDPDGNINLPLIGSIHAVGMTLPGLRDKIQGALAKYVVDPRVDVNASNIKSQKIFVFGEVFNQGSQNLERNMLAWEAISQSGGFTDDANSDNVLLIRRDNGAPRATVVNLNLKKMLDNDGVFQNPFLQNGDIVYVPPRKIASVERFMTRLNNILSPIISLERGIVMVPQVMDALIHGGSPSEIVVP